MTVDDSADYITDSSDGDDCEQEVAFDFEFQIVNVEEGSYLLTLISPVRASVGTCNQKKISI